jgi:seryl-tRNA(Sec) selenium transferase
MQEEIVDKSVDVAAQITSLTLSQILKAIEAIRNGLEKKPEEKAGDAAKTPELKQGKQTLKQLHKHNEGLTAIELTDPNVRQLHHHMKKADIDFSVVKDGKGKYTLFFKGKNADEMTNAFKRYTEKVVARADKKAIRTELREAKAAAKALDTGRDKVKNRGKGVRDR